MPQLVPQLPLQPVEQPEAQPEPQLEHDEPLLVPLHVVLQPVEQPDEQSLAQLEHPDEPVLLCWQVSLQDVVHVLAHSGHVPLPALVWPLSE